jgi:tetratricopeptide (TPR) repeat protein
MKLSIQDTERFYRIWWPLLRYVNAQRKIVPEPPQAESGGTAIISTAPITIQRHPLAAKALETLIQQLKRAGLREQEYQDQIKALTESITALAQQRGKLQAPPGIDEALEQLAQGNTASAEAIFLNVAEKKEAEGTRANQEAAEALRHLGALAFLNDTQKALDAYRRSTELDPKNPDGWNRLGHLLYRTGAVTAAEEAYHKVVAFGLSENDQEWIAIGSGNLGVLRMCNVSLDPIDVL